MSIDASQWAWKVRGVSVSQKVILLSLADRANEQHECWPSMKRLMDDTGINNKRTLIRNIRALEEMGLLVALRDNGYSNRYRLVGVQGREESGGNIATGKHGPRGSKKALLGSSNIATGGKSATGSKSAIGGSGKNATGVVAILPHESKKNLKENQEENIYSGKSLCEPVVEPSVDQAVEPVVDPVVDPVEAVAEQVTSSGYGLAWSHIDKAVVDFVESFVAYVKAEQKALAPEPTDKFVRQSAETVDKLIRLDGFSLETIQAAMRFAVRDDFWAKNALSLCGLRKKGPDGRTKFQKILAAMEQAEARGLCGGQVGKGPRAVTVAQQRAVERDLMAKMLLEDEEHGQIFDVEAVDSAHPALPTSSANA